RDGSLAGEQTQSGYRSAGTQRGRPGRALRPPSFSWGAECMITGCFITLTAIRRQLAAMPNELYLVRPIHGLTGRPCAGERLWSAGLLTMGPAVGFLRARNREGFDIYLSPFAADRNAGYILVDLDRADPPIIHTMRANGHEPCVVL